MFSRNVCMQENRCKLINHWYLTPSRLAKRINVGGVEGQEQISAIFGEDTRKCIG